METINKCVSSVRAYTYLIRFNVNGYVKFYYGVRYGNIKLKLTPVEDLFQKYYTSSKDVAILLNEGHVPEQIIIHKTFETIDEACGFEVKFLKRVNAKSRNDFLNHVDHFNNASPCNAGRVASPETRAKISKAASEFQSKTEYKKFRKELMLEKWADPEFIEEMEKRNTAFWQSAKGLALKELNKTKTLGKTHSIETKEQMSQSAKLYLKNNKNEMSRRAHLRKKYYCPECGLVIGACNFARHLKSSHNYSDEMLINVARKEFS